MPMKEVAEGWDWPRVQLERCPQCRQHPAALAPDALTRMLLEEASAWGRFLREGEDRVLRVSPGAGVWTPLQYSMHVRDMLSIFASRIVRALHEEDPMLVSFDPPAATWVAYNETGAAEAANAIEQEARTLVGVLNGCTGSAWSRTAHRSDGARFTVAGMARFALHEAHHHFLDATGLLNKEGNG